MVMACLLVTFYHVRPFLTGPHRTQVMQDRPNEQQTVTPLPTAGNVTLALETLGSFDFSGNRHVLETLLILL